MTDFSEEIHYHLFDTDLGLAAIAWTKNGICGHLLPDTDAGPTETRIMKMFPTAKKTEPPLEVVMITRRMCKHLQGNTQDFSNVRLTLGGTPLFQAVV